MAKKISDKERLDWLLESGNTVYPTESNWFRAFCGETEDETEEFSTARQAIDAAIRSTRPTARRGK